VRALLLLPLILPLLLPPVSDVLRSRGLRTAVNPILYAAAKERYVLIPRLRKERAVLIPKDALWRVAHCVQPDSEPARGDIPISAREGVSKTRRVLGWPRCASPS